MKIMVEIDGDEPEDICRAAVLWVMGRTGWDEIRVLEYLASYCEEEVGWRKELDHDH